MQWRLWRVSKTVQILAGISALLTTFVVVGLWDRIVETRGGRGLSSIAALETDLGEVWSTPELQVTIPLKNLTDRRIYVRDVTASCSCVEIKPRSFHIEAHQTTLMSVTLDVDSPDGVSSRSLARIPFSANIVLHTVPTAASSVFAIRGTLKRPFSIDIDTLEFMIEDANTELKRTFRVRKNFPCHITVTSESSEVTARVLPGWVARDTRLVQVELHPSSLNDNLTTEVTVIASDASGVHLSSDSVLCRYHGKGSQTSTPARITLGPVEIGSLHLRTARISFENNRLLVFDRILGEHAAVAFEGADFARRSLKLRITPDKLGDQVLDLEVCFRAASGTESGGTTDRFIVPVRVNYYGIVRRVGTDPE